ncbi:MAG: sulfotransferase family 2 domain-containing protein [Pseudomonadota bacterium]
MGEAYFDFWWLYRADFEPLTQAQIDRGFYFVHIPKTAGTSVLSALDLEPTPYTHCPAHILHRNEHAKDLFVFSVSRDPYARFASSFEYITKRTDWPAQQRFAREVLAGLDFDAFTRKLLKSRSFRKLITGYEFFFPQSYFTHRGRHSLIHDVLKFERLSDDFARVVRTRFPDVGTLPKLRDHGGGDYYAMYDTASRQLVQDLYEDDFINFGYSPDV